MRSVKPDPRAGLMILVIANIGMFMEKTSLQGNALTGLIIGILLIYGCVRTAIYGIGLLCLFYVLQTFILPISPGILIILSTTFVNMTRRMLPCLLTGMLLVKKCSLQEFIVAMRKMHLPNNLITALSVTIRYFPAISEEIGHIRDAAKLQRIPFGRRLECYVVPIMLSATRTADELSAAATARGIDNPAHKTSAVEIRFCLRDYISIMIAFIGISFILGFLKG